MEGSSYFAHRGRARFVFTLDAGRRTLWDFSLNSLVLFASAGRSMRALPHEEPCMDTNAFIGKATKPTDNELAEALGDTKPIWDQLLKDFAQAYGVDTHEWKSYSIKAGWALRLFRKKRTIVWMAPCPGYFQVMFILGDKAMKALKGVKLSARTTKIVAAAPHYAEGTGIRLPIKKLKDIADIGKLITVKLEN